MECVSHATCPVAIWFDLALVVAFLVACFFLWESAAAARKADRRMDLNARRTYTFNLPTECQAAQAQSEGRAMREPRSTPPTLSSAALPPLRSDISVQPSIERTAINQPLPRAPDKACGKLADGNVAKQGVASSERASHKPQVYRKAAAVKRQPGSTPPTLSVLAPPLPRSDLNKQPSVVRAATKQACPQSSRRVCSKAADVSLARRDSVIDRLSNVAARLAAAPGLPKSAAARALDNADTLRIVLGYAGAGEWLFLSTISAAWHDGCCNIPARDVQNVSIYRRRMVTLGATSTRASAVFASRMRVIWAKDSGLDLAKSSPQLQIVAGFCADLGVLKAAKQASLPLSADVLRGAALSGDINKLKCLRNELSCVQAYDVADYAASSGNVGMLRWLQPADSGSALIIGASTLIAAHEAGQQRVVQYLRRSGYEESGCARACDVAMKHADRDRLARLRESGFAWSTEFKGEELTPSLQHASQRYCDYFRSLSILPFLRYPQYVDLAAHRSDLRKCASQHREGCLC
jgi:hypothetical protein